MLRGSQEGKRRSPRPVELDVVFLGDTLKVLKTFPEAVQGSFGYALSALQLHAEPVGDISKLEGYRRVYEIRKSYGDAYRLIYLLETGDAIYVINVFKKKSHEAGQVPPEVRDLTRARYKQAVALAAAGKARK